jgi:hypothetical protein
MKLVCLAIVSIVIAFVAAKKNHEKHPLFPHFLDHIKKHEMPYDTTEYSDRFDMFMKRWEEIENHNNNHDAGLVSYKIGLNKFTTMVVKTSIFSNLTII